MVIGIVTPQIESMKSSINVIYNDVNLHTAGLRLGKKWESTILDYNIGKFGTKYFSCLGVAIISVLGMEMLNIAFVLNNNNKFFLKQSRKYKQFI